MRSRNLFLSKKVCYGSRLTDHCMIVITIQRAIRAHSSNIFNVKHVQIRLVFHVDGYTVFQYLVCSRQAQDGCLVVVSVGIIYVTCEILQSL